MKGDAKESAAIKKDDRFDKSCGRSERGVVECDDVTGDQLHCTRRVQGQSPRHGRGFLRLVLTDEESAHPKMTRASLRVKRYSRGLATVRPGASIAKRGTDSTSRVLHNLLRYLSTE